MHRIDGDNVAVALPTPQAVGGTVGFFAAEAVTPATQATGDWLNAVQEEIANAVEDSGGALDKTAQTQLLLAIRRLGVSTWSSSTPLGAGGSVLFLGGSAADILVEQTGPSTGMTRASASAGAVQVVWPIPTDARGISIENFEFRTKLVTAFTGTVTLLAAYLYKINTDGSTSSLGSISLNGLTTGVWSFKTMSDFGISPFVLLTGQGLFLKVSASISGGGAGEILFQQLTLVLEGGN